MKQGFRDAMAQCRCFTPKAAVLFALRAYQAADRSIRQDFRDSGEAWLDESGQPWAGPADFVDRFHWEVTRRLNDFAVRRGFEPLRGVAPAQLGWPSPAPRDPVPSSGLEVNGLQGAESGAEGMPQAVGGAFVDKQLSIHYAHSRKAAKEDDRRCAFGSRYCRPRTGSSRSRTRASNRRSARCSAALPGQP